MKAYTFLILIIFIFLSCSSPEIPNNKNNNNSTDKDNSELTIKERAGKYKGPDHNYPTCNLELNISEQGNLNVMLVINNQTWTRIITSNIDISDKINDKALELKVFGKFKDTHSSIPETSKIGLQFLFPHEINIYFYYQGVLYGGFLEKV